MFSTTNDMLLCCTNAVCGQNLTAFQSGQEGEVCLVSSNFLVKVMLAVLRVSGNDNKIFSSLASPSGLPAQCVYNYCSSTQKTITSHLLDL